MQLKITVRSIYSVLFYIPPKSNQDIWNELENSLDLAANDNIIESIIIYGEFNGNQLNPSNTKVKSLMAQFSLTQLIDAPTNFTANSSSLIDLIMTDNVNSLVYTGVGPPLLEQTRYHCPVIGLINAPKIY